jgi:hypothetical protein
MEGPIYTWVRTRGLVGGRGVCKEDFFSKRLISFEKNQEILHLLFGTLFGTKIEVFFGSPSKFIVGVPSYAIEFYFIFQNFRLDFNFTLTVIF